MTVQTIVSNELRADPSSVWVLAGHERFGYSDGAESEKYLEQAFRAARDLGTTSAELETWIKDWPSEYHLTVKRAQLLSGFRFDRSLKVLEVGCGCGAITRFLGENFDDVVSVEGSIARARLARLRTRDLPGVNILCAPFQEIRFKRKFDVVFCIGVYEYSASFVPGENPYDSVLEYFSELLTPDGMVVIAIENQFGLKYFASATEDHIGTRFEGLEGYHVTPGKVRTFGKVELERNLRRHFSDIRFYYPCPDYKIPDAVLAEEFMASPRAGELVSQLKSRDYTANLPPLFDEASTALELARNGMLPFFSNSFLVIAGKTAIRGADFDQLAYMVASSRQARYRTRTRILGDGAGRLRVEKRPVAGEVLAEDGSVKLQPADSAWSERHSLHTEVYLRARSRKRDLAGIFQPCAAWVRWLEAQSVARDGTRWLDGRFVDCTWHNAFPAGDGFEFVDQEWVWQRELRLGTVVIRAIYYFLVRTEDVPGISGQLSRRSGRSLIEEIARGIGCVPDAADFDAFAEIESAFQSTVFGVDRGRYAASLGWFLRDRVSLQAFRECRRFVLRVRASAEARLGISIGRKTS